MKKTNAQILTRELKRRWVDHRIYNELTGSFCLSQAIKHLENNGAHIDRKKVVRNGGYFCKYRMAKEEKTRFHWCKY